jgi:phage gpG-like protein
MPASITIDASKLHDLLGRFDNAEEVVNREGHAALVRSAAQVEADAKQNLTDLGAVDTGTLRRSIATVTSAFEAAIGTNLSYAEVVEVGRQAGAPMPPSGSLLDWTRRHGIPAENEYIVRRNIGAKGIAARPYLGPALTDNESAIQREFDLAGDRALAELLG